MIKNKKLFNTFKNLKGIFKLLSKYDKKYPIILFCLAILSGIIPYISLLLSQRIMNALQINLGNLQYLVLLIILYFSISIIQISFNNLYSYLLTKYSDYLFTELNILFMKNCSELTYQDYENAQIYDILSRAEQQIGVRPINIVRTILGLVSSLVGFIFALVILSSWHIWALIGFLLLPVISYKYFISINRKEYETITKRTKKERQSWYLSYLMIKDYYIKEVKSLNIYNYLLNKYSFIKREIFDENVVLNKRKSIFSFLYQLSNTVFSLVIVLVALLEAFAGKILLGNFMTYINTSSKVETAITSLTSSCFSIYTDAMFCEHILIFFKLVESRKKDNSVGKIKIDTIDSIEIINLSYKYANSQSYVLKNINITFKKGKKYVLVGENGSGKTTLIKILNGLYTDYEGEIRINGINYKNIDIESIKKNVSAIFQDYNNYEFNVKENIGLGDVNNIEDITSIRKAAKLGGATTFIEKLPNQYDQQLGNWFVGGVQLSGGQWQKIAISRALMKNADVYFFDEPTASLDPSSEYKFFSNILLDSNEKVVIFVTHRFTNAKMADDIIVLRSGEIIERGNHDELMKVDSEYSKLYKMQIGDKKLKKEE